MKSRRKKRIRFWSLFLYLVSVFVFCRSQTVLLLFPLLLIWLNFSPQQQQQLPLVFFCMESHWWSSKEKTKGLWFVTCLVSSCFLLLISLRFLKRLSWSWMMSSYDTRCHQWLRQWETDWFCCSSSSAAAGLSPPPHLIFLSHYLSLTFFNHNILFVWSIDQSVFRRESENNNDDDDDDVCDEDGEEQWWQQNQQDVLFFFFFFQSTRHSDPKDSLEEG